MTTERRSSSHTWASSDRIVPRLIVRPLREFLDTEIAGGIVLLAAALVAMVWANSPLRASYEVVWGTDLSISLGRWSITEDLRHWINDGLMVLFFFVVGLEIKREIVKGELSDPRAAALPVVAALGGMVVPAVIYLGFNAGGPGGRGWGIPMATDIAFALGALALFGRGLPASLRVFLLSLAIVDDIGAILVIALFYTPEIETGALLIAVTGLAIVGGMRALGVWWLPAYAVVGLGVWLATLSSGVHATIAGVLLGVMTPVRALDPLALESGPRGRPSRSDARAARLQAQASVSVAERLAHDLHPWTSFVVVPLFALANAGVALSGSALGDTVTARVTLGIVLGLIVGKLAGILGFAWVAQRAGIAALPESVSWRELSGVATLAGIGFTVSLFIAGLAFDEAGRVEEAKVGILVASVAAAVVGAVILRGTRASGEGLETPPERTE